MANERETELLQNVYRNAEMGRDGLYFVMKKTDDPAMRRVVETQLMEYQTIMDEAEERLRAAGEQPQGSGKLAKLMVRMAAARKTAQDNSPAALADMLIEGSGMGVTKIMRELTRYRAGCEEAAALALRLQKTEENNIERLKAYL